MRKIQKYNIWENDDGLYEQLRDELMENINVPDGKELKDVDFIPIRINRKGVITFYATYEIVNEED